MKIRKARLSRAASKSNFQSVYEVGFTRELQGMKISHSSALLANAASGLTT